jgi:hypothetical protein
MNSTYLLYTGHAYGNISTRQENYHHKTRLINKDFYIRIFQCFIFKSYISVLLYEETNIT